MIEYPGIFLPLERLKAGDGLGGDRRPSTTTHTTRYHDISMNLVFIFPINDKNLLVNIFDNLLGCRPADVGPIVGGPTDMPPAIVGNNGGPRWPGCGGGNS